MLPRAVLTKAAALPTAAALTTVAVLFTTASALLGPSIVRADDPAELAAPIAPEPADAPGVADARLASLDDGIGDRFAAWASERFFGGGTSSGDTVLFLTELGARFGLTSDTRVRVDWGFAVSSSHVTGVLASDGGPDMAYDTRVERVEARNAILAFDWAPRVGRARFSVGLGGAIPLAGGLNTPTNTDEAAAWTATTITHDRMLATAGGLDPWRYRSERFALFLPLELLFPIDAMTISLAGAAGVSIPVIGASGAGVTGDLQVTAQIAGDVIPELRLGLRVGLGVLDIGATSASGGSMEVQPSVTGWARLQLAPAFVVVSVLANLGGPYGLGRGDDGVYAITVGVGASLERESENESR